LKLLVIRRLVTSIYILFARTCARVYKSMLRIPMFRYAQLRATKIEPKRKNTRSVDL